MFTAAIKSHFLGFLNILDIVFFGWGGNKSVLPVALIQKQFLIIRLIVKINSAVVDVHLTHSKVSFHLIQKDISGFQKCTYCKKIRMFRRPVPSGKVEGTAQCLVFENINNDLSAFFGNSKGTVRNRIVLKPDIPFQFTWKNSAVGKQISDFYSTLINIRSKMNPFQVSFIYRLQPYGLPDAAGLRVPDKLAG